MKKGFTLIELLIVIAILAVLATAVVLIINPAELLRQGRDSTRLSDLAAVNNAVALYLTDVLSPGLGGANGTACSSATELCTASSTAARKTGGGSCTTQNSTTTADGKGWVSVDLLDISSGSPLSRLPLDPNNGSTNCGTGNQACYYSFICSSLNYEINAAMESAKFATGGGSDVESNNKDGGDNTNLYELGNKLDI